MSPGNVLTGARQLDNMGSLAMDKAISVRAAPEHHASIKGDQVPG